MSIELPVIVERVTYQKDTFAILAANLDPYSSKYNKNLEVMIKEAVNQKYGTFTIKVNNLIEPIEDISGAQYIFVGDLVNDSKRGLQFVSEFYYLDSPSTVDGLQAFLMNLSNIKEMRSRAILSKFGLQKTIEILDNNPEELLCINGITQARLALIKKEWDEKRYLRTLYHKYKIPVLLAEKIYKEWKNKSVEVLTENPYKLCDLRNIGFLTADRIAHQIFENVPVDFRVKACIKYVLNEEVWRNSNLCVPYASLKRKVIEVLTECDNNIKRKSDLDVYIKFITSCLRTDINDFTVIKDLEEDPNVIYIYLRSIWEKELYISQKIVERTTNILKIDIEKVSQDILN